MEAATDYRTFHLSLKYKMLSALIGTAAIFAVGMVFFRHPLWAAFIALPGLAAPKWVAHALQRRRQEQLSLQFQQLLYSLSSSLNAGKSLENAFLDAVSDMSALYPDARTAIHRELLRIVQKWKNGVPMEQTVHDFGQRSGLEDIRNFAEVLLICKRQGGNAAEAARKAAHLIHEKLDVQRQIAVMTAQKRWESRMLVAAPVAMVAFLSITSGDYMAPLYGGAGRFIMLAAVVVLAGCIWMCMKITDIRL